MSGNELVSIITPVFNARPFLSEAVLSVRVQTHVRFEHILVDDGSTDGSREFVGEFAHADERVRAVYAKQNGGPAAARNLGLRAAQGELVAFLDADDLWAPEKLQAQVECFRGQEGLGLVATNGIAIDEAGRPLGQLVDPRRIKRGRLSLATYLFGDVPIATSSVMVRSECIARCGEFDTRYHTVDDFVMWMRICLAYEIEFIDAPLVSYRQHERNITNDRIRTRRDKLDVYEHEILPNPEFVAELGDELPRRLQRRYCSLGKLYAKTGRKAEAEAQFQKALQYRASPLQTLKTHVYRLRNRFG